MAEFLTEAPLAGAELNPERRNHYGPSVELRAGTFVATIYTRLITTRRPTIAAAR